MPAATTPYGQNDYQAVSNFRPYELPINDVFKSISAQNKFWEIGAEKVKAVHDNALELKLTLAPNKEIRDKYMVDADKQLTKLSTMNLDDPSVQRQGFNLYKPLFKDEGIAYDDLTTRHYEQVRSDAMSYRNKDHGKEYSDINFQYAMDGYKEFANSKDRMAGKQAYENRKDYTPYYDYTDDFSKALKDCHPSSIQTEGPQLGSKGETSGYMHEVYAKSLSSAQAKGCLEAGLSPNAQRQLQIEGAVAYKGHPETLGSDVATYLSGVNTNNSEQLQELAANKAALIKNPGKLSAEELKNTLEQYDVAMKGVSNEMETTNHTIDKINKGDLTDVLNNYEQYAGTIYSYRKLYKKALSSAYTDTKDIYKADPVQMSKIKFTNDVYIHNLDNNFAWSLEMQKEKHATDLKMYELQYGSAGIGKGLGGGADVYRDPRTGEITINPSLEPVMAKGLTDIPTADNKAYQKLTETIQGLQSSDNENNLTVYNKLISRADRDKNFRETLLKGFNYGTTDDEWTRFKSSTSNNIFGIQSKGTNGGIQETTWFKAYMKAQPNDEDINAWSAQKTVVEAGLGTLNRKLEIGEKQVLSELGYQNIKNSDELTKQEIEKIPSIKVFGTTITSKDIQDALERKAGKITEINTYGDYGISYLKIDGKQVQLDQNDPNLINFTKLFYKVKNVNNDINDKLNSKRAKVYNNLGFNKEPWFFTPHDEKSPLVQNIRHAFGDVNGDNKPLEINIVQSDFSGGIKVSFPKDMSKETIINGLKGVGTSVEVDGNIATVKGTKFNLIAQAINNPILQDAAFQLQTISQTSAFQQTQSGQKVPNSDIKVPVQIGGEMKMMTIETHKDGNTPEFRVYMDGGTDARPWVVAHNPYELFEKIGRSSIDLNKPVK